MKLFNLHLNTTFSFLESTITVDDAINKAILDNVEYLTFTEKNNFFSLGEANVKCQQNNIKPIFGLEANLFIQDSKFGFILFAKNKKAFTDLHKISYRLLKNERINIEELLEKNEDIIIVENPELSYYKITKQVIQNNNYYISFNIEEINEYLDFCSYFQNVLIVNNFNTLDSQDFAIIELLNKMNGKNKPIGLNNPLFFEVENNDILIKKIIERTNKVVKNLFFPFSKNNYHLLTYPNNKELDSKNYLRFIILEKIKKSDNLRKLFENDLYKNRLKREFDIISELNFEDYFLIIQD
ncbi:DNA polymerase III subunit alpha [Mycoplasmopsis arginini]|nr:DNA polymerase III subunit alpha [Chlamydia abortus]SGA06448.1 DNA polymerase III subunit alpha [Mycoplasmopsis arginini]SGA10448.1 DNA polymerase III subunit alpha [Mycoplasmopsis arginini]SGA32151.1 DNA polymerase III subunit alpha [Chlamydia abortus]